MKDIRVYSPTLQAPIVPTKENIETVIEELQNIWSEEHLVHGFYNTIYLLMIVGF